MCNNCNIKYLIPSLKKQSCCKLLDRAKEFPTSGFDSPSIT